VQAHHPDARRIEERRQPMIKPRPTARTPKASTNETSGPKDLEAARQHIHAMYLWRVIADRNVQKSERTYN